jgi:hypothetical protein
MVLMRLLQWTVGVDGGASREVAGLDELEAQRRRQRLDQAGAVTDGDGVDSHSVLVDQAGADQRVQECLSAVGQDDHAHLSAQPINLVGQVTAGDAALRPIGASRRRGEHGLRDLVHHLGVHPRLRGPHAGHLLVGPSSHDVPASRSDATFHATTTSSSGGSPQSS